MFECEYLSDSLGGGTFRSDNRNAKITDLNGVVRVSLRSYNRRSDNRSSTVYLR